MRFSKAAPKIIGAFLILIGVVLFVFNLIEWRPLPAALGVALMLLGAYVRSISRFPSWRGRNPP
jgi:membrane-bound ClpP family serine protease